MAIETKHEVLLGLYLEYLKDVPDLKEYGPETLSMDPKAFYVALEKAQCEGLISGVEFIYYESEYVDDFGWASDADWSKARFTRDGLKFIEDNFEIVKTISVSEKAKKIGEFAKEHGIDKLGELAVNVATEVIKQSLVL